MSTLIPFIVSAISTGQVGSTCVTVHQQLCVNAGYYLGECIFYDPKKPIPMTEYAGPTGSLSGKGACFQLAGDVAHYLDSQGVNVVPPQPPTQLHAADVQPPPPTAKGSSGTPAQTDATPSLKTNGLASGQLSVDGTKAGAQTLAVVTLNPFGLGSTGSPDDFAKLARAADVTLLIPAATLSGQALPTFVGLRARVDLSGMLAGAKLAAEANQAVKDLNVAKTIQARIEVGMVAVLAATSSAKIDCLSAIQKNLKMSASGEVSASASGIKEIISACQIADSENQRLQAAEQTFESSLAALVATAQDNEFGLDVELDDPLTSAAGATMPFSFEGNLIAGWHSDSSRPGWTLGIRGSLGAEYLHLAGQPAATGGVGSLTIAGDAGSLDARVHFSLGARGHFGPLLQEASSSLNGQSGDFLDLKVSANVPLPGNSEIGIVVAWPVYSQNSTHGPTIAVSVSSTYLLSGALTQK
jgi:hypothetical protein